MANIRDFKCTVCKTGINLVSFHCECGKFGEYECNRCSMVTLGISGSHFVCSGCQGKLCERGTPTPLNLSLEEEQAETLRGVEEFLAGKRRNLVKPLCSCGHYETQHWRIHLCSVCGSPQGMHGTSHALQPSGHAFTFMLPGSVEESAGIAPDGKRLSGCHAYNCPCSRFDLAPPD